MAVFVPVFKITNTYAVRHAMAKEDYTPGTHKPALCGCTPKKASNGFTHEEGSDRVECGKCLRTVADLGGIILPYKKPENPQ